MVCYSISTKEITWCRFMVASRTGCAVELRLDESELNEDQIRELFARPHNPSLIASYVSNGGADLTDAVKSLSTAILAGADMVDIGLWIPKDRRAWLVNLAFNTGCKVILSYHDFKGIPDSETLAGIVESALREGADIVKIATSARSREEASAVTRLYDRFRPESLVAFAMGGHGKESRLEAYHRGAPLFYIAANRHEKTAPGQYTYFDFVKPEKILLRGRAPMPASKSCAQRAIIMAALAEGRTTLYNFTPCDDTLAAIRVAEQFFADVTLEGSTLTIDAHQNIAEYGLRTRSDTIYVGESGLLARLCIPICALAPHPVTIIGSGTLAKRKIIQTKTALSKFGIKADADCLGHLPIYVHGHIRSGNVEINGAYGSQIISGLLIALSLADGDSTLTVKNVTSAPYLDLTAGMCSYFGLEEPGFPEDSDENTRTYFITGNQRPQPLHGMEIERDWSAAAYFAVAGAMMGEIVIPGMNPRSGQGDGMIFEFLRQCHADAVCNDAGDISVRRSIICPFSYDIKETPDLFGPLLLLALRAGGESCISGLDRLHNKESDRARSFVTAFRRIGADIFIAEDGNLYIEGEPDLRLRGGCRVDTCGDHRLAMALEIAGLICDAPVTLTDEKCISKSFPHFIEVLNDLKTNIK